MIRFPHRGKKQLRYTYCCFLHRTINSFVKKFNKLTIARGKFACGELERALQYLELYIEETDRMQEQLPFMAEIYALLDEPDSIAGNYLLF